MLTRPVSPEAGRDASSFEQWIGMADVHRNTYRTLCTIAAVLNPVFGIIYHFTDPMATDPLWIRFALSIPFLALLGFSYTLPWVQRHFIRLVHAAFYALTVFYVALTTLNGYAPNYAIGLLFVVTAIGVAFSLGLKRIAPLVHYLCFATGLAVPSVFWAANPQVSPAIVSICAVSTALIIYVVARSKLRAEEAMKASEQRYQTLMHAAKDAIFIADPDKDLLIDANEQAQQLVERSLDEIRRMRPAELYPLEKRERYSTLFNEHVFEGGSINGDLCVLTRTGRRVPVDVNASLIDVGGRRLIQGIFRDATERHRYEEQLIRAKEQAEELLRLKSSFLNNMSHELRTPLTSILGYAELLAEEVENGHLEFAQTITDSAKRLQKTLNSVLDLAQLESNKATLDPDTLDIAREVREATALLVPMARRKGLSLSTVVAEKNLFARIDPTCLNRIVNNLVGNAIKFTDTGHVTVELSGDTEHVYMHIKDTGIGISEAFLKHLFDEFRQESTGLSRLHEGNGLGLSITKRLVDLMDGSIEVKSTKGVGSVFTVSFPRVDAAPDEEEPDAQQEALAPAAASSRHKKILVVEDNSSTRHLVTHRLRKSYEVEAVATPEAALERARAHRFDLFLLDINLGTEQDGLELLKILRTTADYANTPAVALTAYAMPGDRERFLAAGFDAYLSKPFTKQQLLKHVEQALRTEKAVHS